MKLRCLLLNITFLLVASSFASNNEIPQATPETFFGNEENLDLVKSARSITVFRIIDSEYHSKRKDLQATHGYKCGAAPVTVDGPEVATAVAALTEMKNFGGQYMCDFDPGVILRITSGKHSLDIIVCFHCGEMTMYGDGEIIRRPYKWAKSYCSLRRPSYEAFAAIAKKAFPKDAEIQALK